MLNRKTDRNELQNNAFLGEIFRPIFSGKEKDPETGYHYFGARYYNSDLSLWLSVDPMSDKYPSLSPYNYCAWNPMKLVDPDGCKIWLPSGREYSPKMETSGLNADDIVTVNALNSICNSEEGLFMLSEICSHTNDVNISLTTLNTENQATGPMEAFYNAVDNKPGSGMGITVDIYWNQSNPESVPTLNGMQSDATYNLLDEICHTFDYCTGYGTNSKFNNDCDKGEFQAVYRSNLVRFQLGDDNYRSQYYVAQDGKSGSGPRTARKGEIYRPSWYPNAKTDKISIPSDF